MTTSKVSTVPAVVSVMIGILLLRHAAKASERRPKRFHSVGEIEEDPVLLVIGALPVDVRLVNGFDRRQIARIVGWRGKRPARRRRRAPPPRPPPPPFAVV